jgi:N-acetylmuramoyl-L-alanine amidase CwlA
MTIQMDYITKFITPNKYSRPQTKLNSVKGIVVHWTASPKGRNVGVWNYFERRKEGNTGYGSAHFIIDLDSTYGVWNCIPLDEMAYHVGSSSYTNEAKTILGSYPNNCTIGIEFCIMTDRGVMTDYTWQTGAKLVAHLLEKFNLGIDDIWTHQEVVGWKDCHRYFVENPNEYTRFKNDVQKFLQGENPYNTSNNAITNEEFYTVKLGDTLWSIARQFNTTVQKLQELNPTVNPSIMPIGQKIKVKEATTLKYQIQSGDTLWGIARKFDTTVVALKDLNPQVDVYALKIGDYIIVKNLTSTSSPSNFEDILPNVILHIGDTGEDVKKLQNALNKLYFNVGYADGIFGLKTEDALLRYQSMYESLADDGIFGTQTREQMLKDLLN